MDILKPYHNPKRDILLTIADIVNTLEQAQDLLQNMTFDTTRVSQSVRVYALPWMKSTTYLKNSNNLNW